MVVEDIHWAEPGLLDLLLYLARFSTDHPLFVLCTSRPEIRDLRPDWGTAAEMVVLEPLDEGESERLIENLLGRVGLAGDVRTRITDAAEGNPLFVEEMLRKLIDDGHLEPGRRPLGRARRPFRGRRPRHDQRAACRRGSTSSRPRSAR